MRRWIGTPRRRPVGRIVVDKTVSQSVQPSARQAEHRRFNTFSGVFRPVFLTILGAMFYLREGWLVGNCGLLGAVAILLASGLITGTTALALSSIASNVPVPPGGAYAIIARALGLEAGGAIGIPLYVAQAASGAMYLYAFTEGWAILFPAHDPRLVVVVGFLSVAFLSWTSATLSFRAQAAMFVLVLLALSSAFLGIFTADLQPLPVVGQYPQASFTEAFSIFFPALTGIMVGVGMSGDLARPRRSIPRGTLMAWGTTLFIYLLAAFWYAAVATRQELLSNMLVMLDHALVGPLVLLGLLCSTLMAALSSVVAAPRLLRAMAAEHVVPGAGWFSRLSRQGEPRVASAATLCLAGLFLLSGSLDAIAPIVTAFFLVTFLAVNLVVLVEQSLGMISFRPTFRVGRVLPLLGVVSCTIGLMLSGPGKGLLALVSVAGIYLWVQHRKLDTPWETVRSGLAVNMALWAARQVSAFERSQRAWKPDLLLPLESPGELHDLVPLASRLMGEQGSVKLVGIHRRPSLAAHLERAAAWFLDQGRHASFTTTECANWTQGTLLSMDIFQGGFFPPNLVLVDGDVRKAPEVQTVLEHCGRLGLGLGLYLHPPENSPKEGNEVVVWLSDRSPDWPLRMFMANLDLPVLLAILLTRKVGHIQLVTVVRDPASQPEAARWLRDLLDLGRLPGGTSTRVFQGDIFSVMRSGELRANIHLLGLGTPVDAARLNAFREAAGAACLFLKDSGKESLLA